MRIGVCDDNREVRELICRKVQGLYPTKTVVGYAGADTGCGLGY